jgi:hypothetical protein
MAAIDTVYQQLTAALYSAIGEGHIYIHHILLLIGLLLEQRKGMLPTNACTEATPFSVGLTGNEDRRPLLIRLLVDTEVALAPTVQLSTAGQDQIFPRCDVDVRYRLVELDLYRLIDARATAVLVNLEFERRVIPRNAKLATVAPASSENSPILEKEEGVVLSTRNFDDTGASDFWVEVVDGFILNMNLRIKPGIALETKLSPVVQSPSKDGTVLEDSEAVEASSSNRHSLFNVQSLGFHPVNFVTFQNETTNLSLFPSTPCVDVTISGQCDEVIIATSDG